MRCEEEGCISSQVYDTCPPHLEHIEEKLHELYDKVEDIHEAVEGCYGDSSEEEKGKKVVKGFSVTVLQCSSDHNLWRIRVQ